MIHQDHQTTWEISLSKVSTNAPATELESDNIPNFQDYADASSLEKIVNQKWRSINKTLKSQKNSKNSKDVKTTIRSKTKHEVEFLERQFEMDPTWSRKTVQICKKALNLKTDQVYKWGYDRKKLLEKRGVMLPKRVKNRKCAKVPVNASNIITPDLNSIVDEIIKGLKNDSRLQSSNSVAKNLKVTKNLSVENRNDNLKWVDKLDLVSDNSNIGSACIPSNMYDFTSCEDLHEVATESNEQHCDANLDNFSQSFVKDEGFDKNCNSNLEFYGNNCATNNCIDSQFHFNETTGCYMQSGFANLLSYGESI